MKLRVRSERHLDVYCPHCRKLEVRRSLVRSKVESLLTMMGWIPFRCLRCEERFHALAIPWEWPKPRGRRQVRLE